MYSDQSQVKRAGIKGTAEIEYIVTEQNGVEINREEVSRDIVSNPRTEIVLVGTQTPPPKVGVGVFINPVAGAYISSPYGTRGNTFHRGLDLAISQGTNIKAADGGKVIFSGYFGSYGYMIEIDHGGGYTTRYGHCSKLLVSKGDKVYQGQVIGLVGSTGYSTGPHLHFEVMKYGKTMNPASWIGQQYK
jgi:murein DD-endopeptidase MepM/ murein hydrolase activator NlpD